MQVLFQLYFRLCGVLCSEFKLLKFLYVYFCVPTTTSKMFIFAHFELQDFNRSAPCINEFHNRHSLKNTYLL